MIVTETQRQITTEIQIVRRRLTPREAACLHEELKSTPNILGYTVRELLLFSDVLIAEAPSETRAANFAGACLSKDLLFGWTDIAALYILPAYRGNGISSRLYATAFAHAQERNRHIYTLSRSPQVIHLMERMEMEMTRAAWKAPLAVHLHMQVHMSCLYRFRESLRKSKMRLNDGNHFVAGMKLAEKKPE